MAIFDMFKRKKIGLKEAGLGLISTQDFQIEPSKVGRPKGIPEVPKKQFAKYIAAYNGIPIVAAAINRTVDFVVQDYYIVSDSEKAKQVCDEFIKDMDFDIFLRNVVRDMLVFGDAFVEIISGNKGIKELKVLNPVNMRVKRTKTGTVTGYYQDLVGLVNPPKWGPDKIAHFIYNHIADSAYGTSIIEPLEKILEIKVSIEEAMKQIVKRKAGAPIHVRMGSDEYPATQDDINSMSTDLQHMTSKTEWVTGHAIEMNVVGFRGKIIDIEPFTDHIDNQMVYGLQVPYVLLGKGRIPEGLARVQLEAMDRRAKSIQLTVEQQLERKIFKKHLDANGLEGTDIEFQWGRPSQDMFTEELTQYMNLLKTPLSKNSKVEIENKIRKLLSIEGEITEKDLEDVDNEEKGLPQQKKEDKK